MSYFFVQVYNKKNKKIRNVVKRINHLAVHKIVKFCFTSCFVFVPLKKEQLKNVLVIKAFKCLFSNFICHNDETKMYFCIT